MPRVIANRRNDQHGVQLVSRAASIVGMAARMSAIRRFGADYDLSSMNYDDIVIT
jgi:hypothetical protein